MADENNGGSIIMIKLSQNIINKAIGAAVLAKRGTTQGERQAAKAALGRLVKRYPALIVELKSRMGHPITEIERRMTLDDWREKWNPEFARRQRARPVGRVMTMDEWRQIYARSDIEKAKRARQRRAAVEMFG